MALPTPATAPTSVLGLEPATPCGVGRHGRPDDGWAGGSACASSEARAATSASWGNAVGHSINARAETLDERPAYRGLARHSKHRCLILTDGYYEWQKPEDPKQPRRPFHFTLEDGEPFCFAGLWTRWSAPGGALVPSCTIVTCQANDVARPIHERMPVILADSEAWEAWLNPDVPSAAAGELLAPLAAERMVVRPANPVVNSARHEGPDCLALAA